MTFLEKKQARAAQIKSELEGIRTLIDVAPEDKIDGHYQRAQTLTAELRSLNADIAELMSEQRYTPVGDNRTPDNPAGLDEHGQAYRTRVDNGEIPGVVVMNAKSQEYSARKQLERESSAQTRAQIADKVLFRSNELMSAKYDTAGIDADKVLRAAITGDYSKLTEAEHRSITPQTGGAMLAPAVSSMVIDNLRQTDWLTAVQPTFISMEAAEIKIPNITALPTAVMHVPGTEQSSSEPTIAAATLSAKTIMTVVEVANELLQDSGVAQGVLLQSATNAISNKLLQQVLYGTGTGAEFTGLTMYNASDFAAGGDMSGEKDLFALATRAKTAILKRNGVVSAMLYDPDLEDRLNKRLATGELVEPSRAFAELYSTGHAIAHPSVASGDMIFMQADALCIGIRQSMEITIDPYSAFNSNITKFRVIVRADAFINAPRVVYYHTITATEPA